MVALAIICSGAIYGHDSEHMLNAIRVRFGWPPAGSIDRKTGRYVAIPPLLLRLRNRSFLAHAQIPTPSFLSVLEILTSHISPSPRKLWVRLFPANRPLDLTGHRELQSGLTVDQSSETIHHHNKTPTTYGIHSDLGTTVDNGQIIDWYCMYSLKYLSCLADSSLKCLFPHGLACGSRGI